MNLQELYNDTVKFTDKEIENVTNVWEQEDTKSLEMYKILIQMGDSIQIAFASTMVEKYKEDNSEFYDNAYNK